MTFVERQENILKSILKGMDKSAIYKHFTLNNVMYETSLNNMHDEFIEYVPIGNIMTFLNTLRALTGDIRASDEEILNYPYIISNNSNSHMVKFQNHIYPTSNEMLTNSFLIENALIKGEIKGLDAIKGKIFHIYDDINISNSTEIKIGDFNTIRTEFAEKKVMKKLEPKLALLSVVGKSRYQKIHAFLSSLELLGEDIEVIFVRPQVLSEMALVIAQREGRYIPLKDICPNLKLIAHYGENIAPYKQSINKFLAGSDVKRMEILAHPSGLLAYQYNIYDKAEGLKLCDEEGVFYEFIPVNDLKPDGTLKKHFRRFHAGNVKIGRTYLVITSNKAGLIGFNTEQLVEVISTEPFHVQNKGTAETLDYFNERINPYFLENLIEGVNKSLTNYNFFIREYCIGDDIEENQPHWIFELDGDTQNIQDEYLQSATNNIHNEMSLQNPYFRQAILHNQLNLPLIHFLPVGSITNHHSSQTIPHIDFTDDIVTIKEIIKRYPEVRTFTPEAI